MDLHNEYNINDEYIKSCINIYIKFNDGDIVKLSNVTDFCLTISGNVNKDCIDIVNCFYSTMLQNKVFKNIGINEIYIKERRINIDDLTLEYEHITKLICKDCFIERFKSFYNCKDYCNSIRVHIEGCFFINE